MSDTWDTNEKIPMQIFVADPTTGAGLSGLVANIAFSIERLGDGYFWNGAGWSSAFSTLTVSEPDSIHQPGRYEYILPAIANIAPSEYVAHIRVNYPPLLNNAENYELYVSRQITQITLYESEPDYN